MGTLIPWLGLTLLTVLLTGLARFPETALGIALPDSFWFVGMLLLGLVVAAVKVPSWLRTMGNEAQSRYRRSDISGTAFLCLNSIDDEALAGLNTAEGIGNIPFVALLGTGTWVSVWVALGLTASGVLPTVPAVLSGPLGQAVALYVSSYLYSVGLFLICLTVLTPLSIVVRGLSLGMWDLPSQLFLRVLVTPTPLYARNIKFVEVPVPDRTRFAHSALYSNPDVVNGICEWLLAIAGNRPNKSSHADVHRGSIDT